MGRQCSGRRDVYKRQTKNGIKQLLIPGMLFENMGITYLGPVDGHDVKAPVSYTHLDVYKRQEIYRRGLYCRLSADAGGPCEDGRRGRVSSLYSEYLRKRAVSYTHLDVYKRQVLFCVADGYV